MVDSFDLMAFLTIQRGERNLESDEGPCSQSGSEVEGLNEIAVNRRAIVVDLAADRYLTTHQMDLDTLMRHTSDQQKRFVARCILGG